MIPLKIVELIQLLVEKTKNKETIWNKGSMDNQFKISVSDGISMTIASYQNNWQDHYEFVIFNGDGNPIQRFFTDNETAVSDFDLLKSFHQAASDSYYKVEETMDALLNSIKSDKIIGKKEGNFDEDDDLPF